MYRQRRICRKYQMVKENIKMKKDKEAKRIKDGLLSFVTDRFIQIHEVETTSEINKLEDHTYGALSFAYRMDIIDVDELADMVQDLERIININYNRINR